MGTGGLRSAGLRISDFDNVLHIVHQDGFEPGVCLDRGEDTRGGGLLASDVSDFDGTGIEIIDPWLQ